MVWRNTVEVVSDHEILPDESALFVSIPITELGADKLRGSEKYEEVLEFHANAAENRHGDV